MFNPELETPEGYEDMEANLLEHRAQEVDALINAKLDRITANAESLTDNLWPCSDRFSESLFFLFGSVARGIPANEVAEAAIDFAKAMSNHLYGVAREEAEEAVPPVTHDRILDALEMRDSDPDDEWEGK